MGSKELHRIPEWQQVTLSWSDVTVTTTARTSCKIRKETCRKTILNSGYIINLAVNNDILSIQIATPRIFSYCYDNHVAFFYSKWWSAPRQIGSNYGSKVAKKNSAMYWTKTVASVPVFSRFLKFTLTFCVSPESLRWLIVIGHRLSSLRGPWIILHFNFFLKTTRPNYGLKHL